MRNNETGEFELVVGNRQLLSGFFIVVLLFAVAFSMGYIVGRNSSPATKTMADAGSSAPAAGSEGRPQPVSAATPAQSPGPSSAGVQPADTAQQPASDAGPQPFTQPAQQPAPVKAPETVQAASPPPAPAPTPAAPAAASEAAPGSYWQVIATANQSSAETLLKTLKDKGFPVSMSPGPNNLMRILVGPYTDTQSMGRAKTELESAGFHPIRK
jgi:cell division septation protein DedD